MIKVVNELISEKKEKSVNISVGAKPPTPITTQPKVKSKPLGEITIDLSALGKFTLTRNEWKLFENIILNTQSYLSKDVLKEFPSSKLKDLFNKLYKLGIIYHDIKTWSWKINYEKLFKRYVVL